MIRLADGLYTWSSFNAEKQYNFNGFLITREGETVVIDPPPFGPDDEAYFKKLAAWPKLVIVTNRNHLRNRAYFGNVPLAMHEAEVDQVDVGVDQRIKDGGILPCGLTAVHLPGKSPGEIGLYQKATKTLILGDALIAPFGALKLIPEAKLDDPAKLKASLKKLKALDFETLMLADGDPVLSHAKTAVDSFLVRL
jgi:glyoxylase-like metal-dependent hydrolase (beta-lactamase superfamily II)